MMKLSDTINMMNSSDYKERFRAEYAQLAIRYYGLCNMLEKWDSGTLEFTPTCSRSIYDTQKTAMEYYLTILESRAIIENVNLEDIVL